MSFNTNGLFYRGSLGICLMSGLFASIAMAQDIGASAQQQMSAVWSAKANLTATQQKIDSNLVFAAMAGRNDPAVGSFSDVVPVPAGDSPGMATVDITGNVTDALLNAVSANGGQVLSQSAQLGVIHASIPLSALESLAASPDVQSIQGASGFAHNGFGAPIRRIKRGPASLKSRLGANFIGSITTQGFVTHSANIVVNNQAISGTGVSVGVLSDSASAARVAALIASGDLPANTVVLAGQAGPTGSTDEGAAMMEIVHDMAPGAKLFFATADLGVAGFASNIIALQQAGCKVIVDDVTYFNEGAFQDGPIAQAINQVTAAGVTYFSSAANSGNLDSGTAGTWEGDFKSGGAVGVPISTSGETGLVHNFGTVASPQNYDVLTVTSSFISLKWSDPLGASTNDYDLFILDSTGTVLKGFSASAQTGTQDPYEAVSQGTNCGTATASGYCPAVGDRIVVVQRSGAARALHIDTDRGTLSLATAGSTFGHNAGRNTVSMAATAWNSGRAGTTPFTGAVNPIESFSSDGPRKIFYNPDGSAITPGNFLFGTNGGTTLQKPDLTAADGASARTPGFAHFFGTSAAAPHAAGIAALILQARPTYTPAQVKAAMTSGTVDNMAPGVDRDSGFGIVMANLAVAYAMSH